MKRKNTKRKRGLLIQGILKECKSLSFENNPDLDVLQKDLYHIKTEYLISPTDFNLATKALYAGINISNTAMLSNDLKLLEAFNAMKFELKDKNIFFKYNVDAYTILASDYFHVFRMGKKKVREKKIKYDQTFS